ncbi:transposase [Edaphobacter modestus]|uniref:Transposase n=1 Tax=Edaphobacter modestus TaxID=388466 RepID=A0A4Q7YSJ8_9BACT|nr:transposase [Edaphobacter modestus]
MGNKGQVGYPSDVRDEEWSFVAPYLALCREDARQRSHRLRAVFNAVRWLVKTGAHWRMMPNDLPPWPVVYQQTRRWIGAGCFEIMVEDLRSLLRELAERKPQPTAMVVDSRTLQSTPESGARAGYDGAKRRKGAKVHAAAGQPPKQINSIVPNQKGSRRLPSLIRARFAGWVLPTAARFAAQGTGSSLRGAMVRVGVSESIRTTQLCGVSPESQFQVVLLPLIVLKLILNSTIWKSRHLVLL